MATRCAYDGRHARSNHHRRQPKTRHRSCRCSLPTARWVGSLHYGWQSYDLDHHKGDTTSVEADAELDLADPASANALVDAAVKQIGPVTALVVAHTHDAGGGVLDVTAEGVDRPLAVNVRGSLLLMKRFATDFRGAHGTGRIVVFTSGPPQTGAVAYAASKGALEWITFSAATELGARGITVNAVNPGPNQTGWMAPPTSNARRLNALPSAAPVGRRMPRRSWPSSCHLRPIGSTARSSRLMAATASLEDPGRAESLGQRGLAVGIRTAPVASSFDLDAAPPQAASEGRAPRHTAGHLLSLLIPNAPGAQRRMLLGPAEPFPR